MPILNSDAFEFFSRSPEQTRRVGIRLGALMKPGDLLCLCGDLGSGKTTLVQGIAQGWGSLDSVTSPTFVLVNVYRRPSGHNLYHFDSYRLGSALEAEDLDLDNMLESGMLVVEWADKIKSVLPADGLWVDLRWMDDVQRHMVFTPRGARYRQMLNDLKRQVYGG